MKKKCIILGGIILAIVIGAGVVAFKAKAKGSEENMEQVTETVPLEKQDLEKSISVTGTIASNSQKVLSSEATDTKVTEINVTVGDMVKKGDVIAKLDRTNLEIKLHAAETALKVAKQKAQLEINGAKRNMDQVSVTRNIELERSNKAVADAYKGYADAVARRDSLYQECQNAIKNLKDKEAIYAGAKGTLDNTAKETESKRVAMESAQNTYDAALSAYEEAAKEGAASTDPVKLAEIESLKKKRDDALVALNAAKASFNGTGAITSTVETDKATKESDYSQAKSDEAAKEADYKAAVANVDAMAKAYEQAKQAAGDSNRTTEKAVADQKDSLLSAELNSQNTGGSPEEIEINKCKELLAACDIVAPMDGIVTSIPVQVGDTYKGGEIMTVQDTSKYTVSALVDQYDISDIFKDMKAKVETQTTGDTVMEGMVTFVSPVPKSAVTSGSASGTSTGTGTTGGGDYEIKVSLNQGSERLRIGMTAKTSIILNEKKGALVVPYYCIQEDTDGSTYIEIMKSDQSTQKIVVNKVMETDYYVAIEGEGLEEGMQAIVPSAADSDSGMMGTSENTGTTETIG